MKKYLLPAVAALYMNTGCDQTNNSKKIEVATVHQENIELEEVIANNIIKVLVILLPDSDVTKNDINKQFNKTNKIFKNSNLDIGFKESATYTYNTDTNYYHSEALLHEITTNPDISSIKKETNSQVAIIFSKGATEYCGLAWGNDEILEKYTYAFVNANCRDSVMAHEIGHTMGLAHSIKQNNNPKKEYAHGYGVDGIFYTTMSYASNYSTNNALDRFSDSSREYQGFKTGNEGYANAVRAIRENLEKYKNINK